MDCAPVPQPTQLNVCGINQISFWRKLITICIFFAQVWKCRNTRTYSYIYSLLNIQVHWIKNKLFNCNQQIMACNLHIRVPRQKHLNSKVFSRTHHPNILLFIIFIHKYLIRKFCSVTVQLPIDSVVFPSTARTNQSCDRERNTVALSRRAVIWRQTIATWCDNANWLKRREKKHFKCYWIGLSTVYIRRPAPNCERN